MKNNIKELEIKNFKSIRHIKFNPKRVNIFIGKPNVGKSNILEGMGLLTGLIDRDDEDTFFSDDILRFSDMPSLFNDLEYSYNNIEIKTDNILAKVSFDEGDDSFSYLSIDNFFIDIVKKYIHLKDNNFVIDEDILWRFFKDFKNIRNEILHDYDKKEFYNYTFVSYYDINGEFLSKHTGFEFNKFKNPVRKYSYKDFKNYNNKSNLYLLPPFGENLFSVLESNNYLLNEIASFFDEQNLDFVLLKNQSSFAVQKKVNRYVTQFPYSSIADTLKRVIFYLAAIETNKDAVLLFEEPEVHSYPPYIKMLADRIALDEENQYFLSTHSPYMLNTLIDSLGDGELNIVLTYYEDYQTKVKVLDSEELSEMQQMGVDVFFNLDRFEGEKVVS